MSATRIAGVDAWEALDSRGTPTVACELRLAGGARGVATAPSGASTGSHEAIELRDGDRRYCGLGVRGAVRNVRELIGPALTGLEPEEVDDALRELDGTPQFGRLGANAVIAVSIAAAVAAADAAGLPLYRWLAGNAEPLLSLPMVNVVSGGAHAARAVDVQDLLVVPVGASSFEQALEWAWRVRRATVEVAAERGLPATLIADEGGLGPPLRSSRAALELLAAGIERSGLSPSDQAAIAVDVAASQLAADGRYHLDGRALDAEELLAELTAWCDAYPIVSIEDPLADDDWDGWRAAGRLLGARLQLVGDDLFATDVRRLERGIAAGAANAVLLKPNQVGTLSGTRAALDLAQAAGYATIVSARSGDTEESWLADLAVGWRAGQIKVGSVMRSERTAKWNRLLRIEAELGAAAVFAGSEALAGATPTRLGGVEEGR